jgi:DNA-binding NtrC family response regulator
MGLAAAVRSSQDSAGTVIASPNADFRRHVLNVLRSSEWSADEALGGAEALAKVEAGGCRLLLLDRWLPDLDVGELLKTVKAEHPQVEVFVFDSATGMPLIDEEPPLNSRLGTVLHLLQSWRESSAPIRVREPELPRPREALPTEHRREEALPGMIGSSPAMHRVYRLAKLVAPRTTTVSIAGETGTGKELVARAIHQLGPRTKQPFVTVNCAAIPESLLESELFGYARGAFTGAVQSRLGRIHSAHGGTLFLDEVGELPLSMQAKLLRFLQEGEVQRLGSHDVVKVDVRVISASNANLAQRVAQGRFREDLYYRLSVFPIDLVPLRDRRQDILPLCMYFLSLFCQESDVPDKVISEDAGIILEEYRWPGNVREVRHVIERAFILSEASTEIQPEHLILQPPPALLTGNSS